MNYLKHPIFYYLSATLMLLSCKEIPKGESSTEEIQESKPNIIMIVADDMGWHDLGTYGNTFIETPNLDRLAANGLKFTDAYAAAPLCSPSRASLMTGLHPITVNITEHIHGNRPAGPKQMLKTPPVSQQLDLDYKTLAEALKEKGYNTGFFGKWHLGGGKFEPQHQGFDVNVGGSYNGLPSSFFFPFFRMGEKPALQNNSNDGDYLTDVLTNQVLDYINKQKDSAFFISLNYYAPHVPIEAKDSLVKKYTEKRGDTSEAILPNIHYAAMVESIDINVGRIIKMLEEQNLDKKTLIAFTSDNGGLSVREVPAFAKHTPPTDNGPLRAGKGYLYEGGIREPLIVSWPDKLTSKEINTPVVAQDLVYSLSKLTGCTDFPAEGIDIFNLENNERGLLWHLPHYSPQHGKPATAYRKGDWKLVYFYEEERSELYNLEEDLGETKDLSEENRDKAEAMYNEMQAELKRLGAKFPKPNTKYNPSAE
ncbi:sulfatase [Joostella atrarenae]|uniref:Sulfatase n=1 Tax=Joostella atrarenae TaxID=679257 RepID=A0ABS9J4Z5_9FLAO|nr:sulfatase [Joostella atrarenae]MCF8715469.1 sulfatase [Joostella atrarenae]